MKTNWGSRATDFEREGKNGGARSSAILSNKCAGGGTEKRPTEEELPLGKKRESRNQVR